MNVKISYNHLTGDITGFYPLDITYQNGIPEPNIEVNEVQWADCVNNPGQRKIDLNTFQIIVIPPYVPTIEEEQNNLLSILNAGYADKLAKIERTAGKAPLLKRAGIITEQQEQSILDNLANQYAEIAQELRQKQNEILGGN